MSAEEIFKTMQDLIVEQFAIEPDDVTMNSSFEDDLAALKTVGDCVRYLTAKLN